MGEGFTGWCRKVAAGAGRTARRPAGLVERTRWLFWLAALVSLLIAVPGAVLEQSAAAVVLVAVASAVCCLVWCRRYVLRRAPLLGDLVEAGAVLLMAAAAPTPAIALGITFSAAWQRAVYGSTWRGVLWVVLVVAGLAAALPVWPAVPGHTGRVAAAPLLGSLPTMFLVFAVARHLGGNLFARERAGRQQDALTALSLGLMGVVDREQAYALAWRATEALCDATPGLRALAVGQHGPDLLVVRSAGRFACVPDHLAAPGGAVVAGGSAAVEGDGVDWSAPVTDGLLAQLEGSVGARLAWTAHRLPEVPDGWMLVGAPQSVPADVQAAVWSINRQVALAARNADARAELVAAARTDSLTDLPNRTAFAHALSEAVGGGEAVAVLFCDLDDFKVVNDGMGHEAGDDVLREVAARLRVATRTEDLCARLGGDEFAVLLRARPAEEPGSAPDDLLASALSVAQRLQQDLRQPVRTGDRWASVAVSIGIATGQGPAAGESVVRHADVAMYAAKARSGQGVQVFGEELLEELDDVGLIAELRTAAVSSQLRVHYQPVVSLRPGSEGRCEAVEALVRWQHPVRGLLGAGQFVPLAERCGAIDQVGAFVLDRACRDAALWQLPGRPVEVHVNVSPLQLGHAGFPAVVAWALARSGLDPHLLVLEVTESAVADGAAQRQVLLEVRRLGVQVALDDFGTGYSSLATLRALPVDVLKIDRSFVTGCQEPQSSALLKAVVGLAEGLGLRTVAEGVETTDELEHLRSLGVGAVQGYLLQRPAPVEELTAWLPTGRRDDVPSPRRPTAAAPPSEEMTTTTAAAR
ncbi:EAL domain-containing protein [Streptomyces sp. NP160]|uniref:putative bifunctional diguanylate cyclase/phosphodiesterase n=1 Tax=Streptomyces sp. NP160 TaxID=2586637 RepID=UPI001119A444|nr:EAL domain-containing protein [Streptomyces sp. NP160]TNM68787.1 EAL domain-containing protein [Streptomyces sp. NP160]